MRILVRWRKLGLPLAGLAIAVAALTGVANASSSAATPIKIGVMSDCKGAFGSFDAQDQAGVYAALSQYAGAKPKDPNDPRKGITGGSIAGHPIKIVAVGCGSDNADLAIKETRRIMEQNKADVMIGPLSGDESVAIAQLRQAAPDADLRRRLGRRAGHHAEGAGAELLPLQRRRRAVERRSRRPRAQQARLEDGRGRGRQLQLRLDLGGRLHRRVLRGRRQGRRSGCSRRSTRPTTRPTPSSSRPMSTARSSRSADRA